MDYNFLKHGITSSMINQAIQTHNIINDEIIKADIEETEKLKMEVSSLFKWDAKWRANKYAFVKII